MSDLILDRLYKLINVSLTVNDNYDNFEVVLQRLLHAIEIITNCEATSLLVYEPQRKDLQFKFATGRTATDLLGLKVPKGHGIAHTVANTRKGIIVNNPSEFDHYTEIDKTINYNTRNLIAFPVLDNNGEVFGVVEACNKKDGEDFTKEDFQLLSIFCQQAEKTIRHALHIHSLRKTIFFLQKSLEKSRLIPMIYVSKEVKNIMNLIKEISPSNSPVLITGDKGTGKSLCAQYIHLYSQRKTQPIISLDCHDLITKNESINDMKITLWGVGKNYKIGIKKDVQGIFEQARGGTLIIEEIGLLPLEIQQEVQVYLLHRFYRKFASDIPISLDTRVIATCSIDLDEMVKKKIFLEELFFLINSLSIHFTPINTRIEDLQVVAEYYVEYFIKKYRKNITNIDPKIYILFKRYIWKFNFHTLINTIEYLILYCDTNDLTSAYVASYMYTLMGKSKEKEIDLEKAPLVTLKEATTKFKTRYIYKALLQNNWNHTKTSKILDIQRSYLSRLVKEYSLKTKNVLSKSIQNDYDDDLTE